MIIKDRDWILIIPSVLEEFEKRPLEVAGKWSTFLRREELHLDIDQLDRLVEEGEFIAVMITNKRPGTDPFRRDDCVIAFYTSDAKAQIEKTEKRLRRMGLNPYAWKSEEKINKGWIHGGKEKFKPKHWENRPGLRSRDILVDNSPDSRLASVEPSPETKGTEEKRARIPPDIQHPPLPPFQLDWIEPRLVDAHGRPFDFSENAHRVLKVMLSKEPGRDKIIRGFLSDRGVAALYSGKEIDDPEEARKIAMNFARNLRKTFAKYGLDDPHALIGRRREKKEKPGGYFMGKDWHPKRPLINQAEVPVFFRDDLDNEPEDPDEE